MKLEGMNAVVTGAGKGIGKAIATALAQKGVNVGLIARSQLDVSILAKELSERYHVRAEFTTADIAVREQVDGAVHALSAKLGDLDILINNAGIGTFGLLAEMPPEEWERIIRVNLLGTYYVTHAVLPMMIARQSGSIINISSTSGERGAATTSAYSASKFGIMGMTESLMYEVRKHNIRVTVLAPSTVNTELAAKAGLKTSDEEWMMQPEDLGQLVVDILELPQRVYVKTAGLWMTKPQ